MVATSVRGPVVVASLISQSMNRFVVDSSTQPDSPVGVKLPEKVPVPAVPPSRRLTETVSAGE